jgi:cystathionine beta-lyase/cystathionine gamma-synthase
MTHQHPSRMGHPRASVTSPSAPPIYQTTAFDVPDLDVLHALYEGKASGDVYTRDSNPNHTALAESIAIMEDAEAGAVFASGMGAAGSVFSVSGFGRRSRHSRAGSLWKDVAARVSNAAAVRAADFLLRCGSA